MILYSVIAMMVSVVLFLLVLKYLNWRLIYSLVLSITCFIMLNIPTIVITHNMDSPPKDSIDLNQYSIIGMSGESKAILSNIIMLGIDQQLPREQHGKIISWISSGAKEGLTDLEFNRMINLINEGVNSGLSEQDYDGLVILIKKGISSTNGDIELVNP